MNRMPGKDGLLHSGQLWQTPACDVSRDLPFGHGCVLRLGGAAGQPGAARPAGHRRGAADPARRGVRGQLRGARNSASVRPCPARRRAGFAPKAFSCGPAWTITGRNRATSWRSPPETGAVVEQMSIDEAYLDLSALCQAEDADASLRRALPLARELKQRICSERRLTATIGIAANKLLAKIASDHQKPDGLTLIAEEEKVQFLRPLPVRALYGVGKVTEAGAQPGGDRDGGGPAGLSRRPAGAGRLVRAEAEAIRLRPGRPPAGAGR